MIQPTLAHRCSKQRLQVVISHRWKVLIVVSVAAFMASLDVFIVNIAFRDIQSDFGEADIAALSWVLNAYAIVFAALLVPAGRLADRMGRKRSFLGGLAIFLVGSLFCGIAPSAETLIGARVLQAVGAASLLPTSLALLLPEFPAAERAKAIGIWAAVGGVAAAAGPPLGGLLVEVSWRLVFFVNIPVGLIAGSIAVNLLVETRDDGAERAPDPLGTVLLTLGSAVLALALVKAPDWHWSDARTVLCLFAAAAALAAFARRCATHPVPVVEPALLRVRSFALANLAVLFFSAGFAAMLLANVLFVTGVWHYSVVDAGFAVAPGPVMASIAAVAAGHVASRIGQRYLAGIGCLLLALAAVWWRVEVDAQRAYLSALLPGQILSGTGVGLALSSLSGASAASLPPARFATGSAIFTMGRQMGTVLGVAILVAILGSSDQADALTAFQHGWTFVAIAAATGAALSLSIGRVVPHVVPTPVPAT
jgi:EmrB/QacA subfamily drug resistance transporter